MESGEADTQRHDRILANPEPRKDFISVLVQRVREGLVDKEEMTAHVSTLT